MYKLFQRCYYGKEYPEIENEYNYDVDNNNYENNSKWDEYRSKIDEYEILLDSLTIEDENDKESVINKCPLCRK